MHGLFLIKFQQFVQHALPAEGWAKVASAGGLRDPVFQVDRIYPDELLLALIQAAAAETNTPIEEWWEAFGRHLAPDLIKLGHLLKLSDPGWTVLDYVVHAQSVVHAALNQLNPGIRPARLIGIRYTPRKAILIYLSPRHWPHLVKGILLGLGECLHERFRITMTERRCLLTNGRKENWFFLERLT